MKIDEFIEKVNQIDRMEAEKVDGVIVIYDNNGHPILSVSCSATNLLELGFREGYSYYCFSKSTREYLSALIDEFLETPIKERFPEKKYRLRWIDYLFSNDSYHNPIRQYLYKDGNNGWDLCDYKSITYKSEKAVFTESELERIKRDAPCLETAIDAMKEEVKDDE